MLISSMSFKVSEKDISEHQQQFLEIHSYLKERRHDKFIAAETEKEFGTICKSIEKRRIDVDKQLKEGRKRYIIRMNS